MAWTTPAQRPPLTATVDGDVGVDDAIDAVAECLATRGYDRIIVSTLPVHLSRWWRQDGPHRIQRKFAIQVTTVRAAGE